MDLEVKLAGPKPPPKPERLVKSDTKETRVDAERPEPKDSGNEARQGHAATGANTAREVHSWDSSANEEEWGEEERAKGDLLGMSVAHPNAAKQAGLQCLGPIQLEDLAYLRPERLEAVAVLNVPDMLVYRVLYNGADVPRHRLLHNHHLQICRWVIF